MGERVFAYYANRVHGGWEMTHDCGSAPRSEILWHYFLGDVAIEFEDQKLQTTFGMVPVLHFIGSLLEVAKSALDGDLDYRYAFTEVSGWVDYRLEGNAIGITCSFAPGRPNVPVEHFVGGTTEFAGATIQGLGRRFPRLLDNPVIDEMRDECALLRNEVRSAVRLSLLRKARR